MDNNINYIAFDFVEGNNNEISPNDVEVEITALDKYKIAEYKFDNTLYDNFPIFNDGFSYTHEDVVNGDVTTRTIYSDSLPNAVMFGYDQGATDWTNRLLEVNYLDATNIINMYAVFAFCQNLTYVNINNVNIITSTLCMFYNCQSLTSLDLSNWQVDNVTNMEYMFYGCNKLTSVGDLSNWQVDNVTNMEYMFCYCQSLTSIDLSNWDTSNVTEMQEMFRECYLLKEIKGLNNWDTSNAKDSMYCMFYYCKSLEELDLSGWDVSNITDMRWLFSDCTALKTLNISNWSINNEVVTTEMLLPFYESEMTINKIIMNNSDYNSVNKIISELPVRTTDSIGTLNVAGIDDINQVDTATAESKFWNIVSESVEPEDGMDNIKLGSDTIKNMYIGDSRIIQMYLNGQPLM